eukprot:4868490-Pleurochrysis_carterae.AAC.1
MCRVGYLHAKERRRLASRAACESAAAFRPARSPRKSKRPLFPLLRECCAGVGAEGRVGGTTACDRILHCDRIAHSSLRSHRPFFTAIALPTRVYTSYLCADARLGSTALC